MIWSNLWGEASVATGRKYISRGFLLDGERKSVQPIAGRIAGADEQALNQFLNQSPWEVSEIQKRLARRLADEGVDPIYWVIDETSFPKAGEHSVGVARQYCGALGKIANCQVAVSLHWSQSEVSYPLSWRLFLPEDWIKDPARRRQARIPAEIVHRTKQALALELIGQAQEWACRAARSWLTPPTVMTSSFVLRYGTAN
ncbi:MAG: IS701 family transposase [Lacunisphaera sp.]